MRTAKGKSGSVDLALALPRSIATALNWLRFSFVANFMFSASLCLGVVWLDRERSSRLAAAEALTIAEVLAGHAQKVLDTSDIILMMLDRRIEAMSWDDIRQQHDRLTTDIAAIIANYPHLSSVGLTDAQGRQWLNVVRGKPADPSVGDDVTAYEYWQGQSNADHGTLLTNVFYDQQAQQMAFGLSRRRTAPGGQFDGTVHITLAADYFSDFWIDAIASRKNARIALIRADGQLLAHVPSLSRPYPPLTLENSPTLRHMAAGVERTTFTALSPIDDETCIYASTRVEGYPIYVSYGISETIVFREWWQRAIVTGLICLLSALTIAAVILVAIHHATRAAREEAGRLEAERIAMEGQKLEVLGLLVAGFAHDFRNIVQAIGAGATVIERITTEARVMVNAQRIAMAVQQAAALIGHMLDFARGDALEGEDADLEPEASVAAVSQLLSTALGTSYKLRCQVEAAGLPRSVRGDASGLQRALMNLVINARDAMPSGGEIVLRLEPAIVHDDWPHQEIGLSPGLYARISVIDTGIGMSADVLARAGETFFTTKLRGRGTGLGLAGARHYAQRYGGGLLIESTLGVGTTVTMWLPASLEHWHNDQMPARSIQGRQSSIR